MEKFLTLEGWGYLKDRRANKPFFIMNTQGTCQSCGAVGPNLWACLQVKRLAVCVHDMVGLLFNI